MLSVTFDRTSLGLDPLEITGDHTTGAFYLDEKDITWPAFLMRRTYAPDSDDVAGAQLQSAVADQGTIGLRITAHHSTTAELKAAMDELTEATTQFSYTLTLEVDGVTFGTYWADPEYPQWGALLSENVRAKRNEATITIPINPPGSP